MVLLTPGLWELCIGRTLRPEIPNTSFLGFCLCQINGGIGNNKTPPPVTVLEHSFYFSGQIKRDKCANKKAKAQPFLPEAEEEIRSED